MTEIFEDKRQKKMNQFILLSLVMVVIIAVADGRQSQEEKCAFDLDISDQNKIQGKYEVDGWNIGFKSYVEKNLIKSITTFHNASSEESFVVELSFPFTSDRQIPGMLRYIVSAAAKVAQETNCELSEDISELYEEFAETLYECTTSIGTSQLRFSLMYHVPIMGSVHRICSKSETICTPSPAYEYGNELFICSEDLEELFPDLVEKGKQMKLEAVTMQRKMKERIIPRGVSWWCKLVYPLGWGLQGGDHCCCGNYDGCCVYANLVCCVHDAICNCCQYGWFCGWQCQPSPGC